MNLKEIHVKAGTISTYFGYVILLFAWNVVNYGYTLVVPESAGAANRLLAYVLRLLIGPIVLAIFYGSIYERQICEDEWERKSIFNLVKRYALRFIGANLVDLIIYLFILAVVLVSTGKDVMAMGSGNLFLALISASSSTLMLYWYCGIAVEAKLWRSLLNAIRTLFSKPLGLVIAAGWILVCLVDYFVFDSTPNQIPLAITIARAGVFAVLKTLAVMYLLVIYRSQWGALPQASVPVENQAIPSSARRGEGMAKVSLGFAFFSFVPLFHLVALILGLVSLKRAQRFILKAAIAACLGGFFTLLYALVIVGAIAGEARTARMPGYGFLATVNEDLQASVDLLGNGENDRVLAQLGDSSANLSAQNWTVDTTLALARYQSDDLDGALKDFYRAAQKKPERSEFYFYYGLALLDQKNLDMAREQFQLALAHEPQLEIARQYASLDEHLYQPNVVSSALMYLVILFFLFTVHEYGHAYAAWKLGDDTAKNQGRLTLNPIAHLDVVGSILLPAILLFQNSGVFFGWARPVPVDPSNFKQPRKDHMLVSFAGPAVNLLVAMACALVLIAAVLLTRLVWPETVSMNLVDPNASSALSGPPAATWVLFLIVFLKQLFYTSLILGIFNLLPIPPLDGSWILEGILPAGLQGAFSLLRRFGFLLFLLLAMTPMLDSVLGVPIGLAWGILRAIASAMGFG